MPAHPAAAAAVAVMEQSRWADAGMCALLNPHLALQLMEPHVLLLQLHVGVGAHSGQGWGPAMEHHCKTHVPHHAAMLQPRWVPVGGP